MENKANKIYSMIYRHLPSGKIYVLEVATESVAEANDLIMKIIEFRKERMEDYELLNYFASEMLMKESDGGVNVVVQDYQAGLGVRGFINNLKILLDETKSTKMEKKVVGNLMKSLEKKFTS